MCLLSVKLPQWSWRHFNIIVRKVTKSGLTSFTSGSTFTFCWRRSIRLGNSSNFPFNWPFTTTTSFFPLSFVQESNVPCTVRVFCLVLIVRDFVASFSAFAASVALVEFAGFGLFPIFSGCFLVGFMFSMFIVELQLSNTLRLFIWIILAQVRIRLSEICWCWRYWNVCLASNQYFINYLWKRWSVNCGMSPLTVKWCMCI